MSYFDEVGYGFIGTQTTLPVRSRKRSNPIGFVWPKVKPRNAAKKKRKGRS